MAQSILLDAVCVFHKSHFISSMFHRTLLDTPFSSPFSTSFSAPAPGPSTSPSPFYPPMSPSTATLQEVFSFGRLAEQSPLTAPIDVGHLADKMSRAKTVRVHRVDGHGLKETQTECHKVLVHEKANIFAIPLESNLLNHPQSFLSKRYFG